MECTFERVLRIDHFLRPVRVLDEKCTTPRHAPSTIRWWILTASNTLILISTIFSIQRTSSTLRSFPSLQVDAVGTLTVSAEAVSNDLRERSIAQPLNPPNIYGAFREKYCCTRISPSLWCRGSLRKKVQISHSTTQRYCTRNDEKWSSNKDPLCYDLTCSCGMVLKILNSQHDGSLTRYILNPSQKLRGSIMLRSR